MNDIKFFYCYNKRLYKYLRFDKGIEFICSGLHVKSQDQFWQFLQNEELTVALEEYKKNNNYSL